MKTVHWYPGTATDLFASLFVLHHAGDFGLRPAWAAGVRQRLSPEARESLDRVFSFSSVPLEWISRLPSPGDARTALQAAARLPAGERLAALTLPSDYSSKARPFLERVAHGSALTPAEKAGMGSFHGHGRNLEALLAAWQDPAALGTKYLAALQEYQQLYFAEEEARLAPLFESGLAEARLLAQELPPVELVERLSRGVRLEDLEVLESLTLLPSAWVNPLAFLAHSAGGKAFIAFPVQPGDQPGSEAPAGLVAALKALGDPTRLRILRILGGGPLSPSELARLLRLRPPTVIHHLHLLRLAGLVQVTVSQSLEKRYAARLEALKSIRSSLEDYLSFNG